MRISDWSSDVCSSDLSLNTWPVGTGPYMLVESIVNRRHVLQRNPNFRGEPYPCQGEPGDRQAGLLDDCGKDRKCVVSGKSGSVRVTLGGGRMIKNKKKKQTHKSKDSI